jgi:putative NADH-flavin reductase
MKLLLLGATGKAGSAFLEQALERGHLVTAVVPYTDQDNRCSRELDGCAG